MNEIQICKATKHMKLNFYIPTNTPQYVGGEKNIHFKYQSYADKVKKMKKKAYKQRQKHLIQRPLLETLVGFIEASKCKTLDQFITKGVKP
jgi:hypothetical protein